MRIMFYSIIYKLINLPQSIPSLIQFDRECKSEQQYEWIKHRLRVNAADRIHHTIGGQ